GLARKLYPGEQSEILSSGFRKFTKQLSRGQIKAETLGELFGLLKRRILDKVSESRRKDGRRKGIVPVIRENDLLPAHVRGSIDEEQEGEGIAQWGISREPPPEFQAMIADIVA